MFEREEEKERRNEIILLRENELIIFFGRDGKRSGLKKNQDFNY